jgi:hypothetical protein
MSRSSFPQRVGWPKLLPGYSGWSAAVGVLLSGISLLLTGNSGLDWGTKIGLCLIAFVFPILAYVIWRYTSVIVRRLKQYGPLYDELERTASDNQQLRVNLRDFIQNLPYVGLQVFEVTGIQWSNPSPVLVIACNQKLPLDSKLVVIKVSNLDALGRFAVEQTTSGGYFVRVDQIFDPVWWGYLRLQVDHYHHQQIDGTVAILLP